MGAPDLTHPGAFIYGSSFAQLQQTIRYGRQGVMPAQQEHLGNDKVHLLAAYVYSLSHGEERRISAPSPRPRRRRQPRRRFILCKRKARMGQYATKSRTVTAKSLIDQAYNQ